MAQLVAKMTTVAAASHATKPVVVPPAGSDSTHCSRFAPDFGAATRSTKSFTGHGLSAWTAAEISVSAPISNSVGQNGTAYANSRIHQLLMWAPLAATGPSGQPTVQNSGPDLQAILRVCHIQSTGPGSTHKSRPHRE